MSVSSVTKAGTSRYSGVRCTAITATITYAATDRSLSKSIKWPAKPASKYQLYSGGQHRWADHPFGKYNGNKDKLFFFFGLEVQQQDVEPG